MILPTSSYAQLTEGPPSSSPTPITLQASSLPPTGISSVFTNTTSSSPTARANPNLPTASSDPDQIQGESHVFNYYFLIVAIVVVLFALCILYVGKRKKRKAALLRNNSQRALAQDVAGFRQRFGRPRPYNGFGFGLGTGDRNRQIAREEGLDERGEAPPPYIPGSKPPSLRSIDLGDSPADDFTRTISTSSRGGGNEAVEMHRMNTDRECQRRSDPPLYHEATGQDHDIGDVRRPPIAVTTSENYGSTRRLLSSNGRSSN